MIRDWISLSRKWAAQYGQIIVWATLIFFAFDLLYWRIIRGYTPPVSYVPWPPAPDWVETMYAGRWALRVLEAAGGVTLLYLEVIDQSLSRWVRARLESRTQTACWIIGAGLLLGSYLIQPGHFAPGDATAHIGTPWALRQSMIDGQWFVFWTNYAYLGNPFTQFYSPAYYYLVAITSFLIRDFNVSAEVVLLIAHGLSALAMYLYVRQLTGSRVAGAVAAVTWSATFYRYHLAMILGKLPTALFVSLWPLQFYLIEKLIAARDGERKFWAGLALTIGAMFWTHMLYGGWMILLGCFYTLCRLAIPWQPKRFKESFMRLLLITMAHGVGAMTALYYLIPSFTEKQAVNGGPLGAGFGLPTISLAHVMIFKESYLSDWFGGFVGNTIIAFAIEAILLILILRYSVALALLIQFALVSLLTFLPYYAPTVFDSLFAAIPFGNIVYSAKTPGLYLIVLIGPASALAGVSVHLLVEAKQRWLEARSHTSSFWESIYHNLPAERIGLTVSLILLLELVPLSLWVNIKYPDYYSGVDLGRAPILKYLAEQKDKRDRVVDANTGGMNNWYYLAMMTEHPGLIGHTPDGPKEIHSRIFNLTELLEKQVPSGTLSQEVIHLLDQFDIGYVITSASVKQLNNFDRVMQTEIAALWHVRDHAPITATKTLRENNRLPVEDSHENIRSTILEYTFDSYRAQLNFSLPQRAFVQLAYSAYPYQKVILDGQPIQVTPTALGLIGFWAEGGTHAVTVTPELSPLRQWTLAVSAITTILLIVMIVLPIRRTK